MLLKNFRIRESRLFTYAIASGDMRYIAINERTVYLRNDPVIGPVLRGEICELGPDCHANLSQVLLEYALSCEQYPDQDQQNEMVASMGERLGRLVAKKLYQDVTDLPVTDQVCGAFEFIFRSMGAQYQIETKDSLTKYDLSVSPFIEMAKKTGMSRGLIPARNGFIAICSGMLSTLAPQWRMTRPSMNQADNPLMEIVLQYSA